MGDAMLARGGVGNGRGAGAGGDEKVSCGTPGGGRNVKLGLNSGAAALSGLPNEGARMCPAVVLVAGGVKVVVGGGAPKTKGLAKGFSDSVRGAGAGIGAATGCTGGG